MKEMNYIDFNGKEPGFITDILDQGVYKGVHYGTTKEIYQDVISAINQMLDIKSK